MVMTVYMYPAFATGGFHLLFFLLLGGFLWFIPIALCSAEMASVPGWENGGIFSWVSGMLGERWGFAAVFFQWFQITAAFVTMLYFVLGSLAYLFGTPMLADDPGLKFAGVMVIFWGLSFAQFGGTRYTALIAKVGYIGGVIVPALVLITMGIIWFSSGLPLAIEFSWKALLPDFTKVSTLVVFASFIFAFMGVEASAPYVNELVDSRRNYPLCMTILVILAIVFDAFGGITVASLIPLEHLSLDSGVVDSFRALFLHLAPGHTWVVNILAALLALGVIGEVSSWIVGPSRAVFAAAQKGLLPPVFSKTNKHDVPVPLILVQGLVVTVWALALTFGGGGGNLSFLIAIGLPVVINLSSYILFFISYIRLIRRKDLSRSYQVPGGMFGKYFFSIAGLLVSIFAYIISFIPPASLLVEQDGVYEIILALCYLLTALLPFVIYQAWGKHHSDLEYKHQRIDHSMLNKFVHPRARGIHEVGSSTT
jgi:glutamate:gamma-aminobutyrate antiporter